jgi:hypothetical protein
MRSGEVPINLRRVLQHIVDANALHPVKVARNHQAQDLVRGSRVGWLEGVDEGDRSMKRRDLCRHLRRRKHSGH